MDDREDGGLHNSPGAPLVGHDQTPRTRSPGERATHPWLLTLTSLIVILLFSLGLWWVVWKLTLP
jgi:hypothetical protein